MNDPVSKDTTPDVVLCGNSLIGPKQGDCKSCHKPSATLVRGYCTTCALQKGLNPLAPPQPKCDQNVCSCDD
jgi:hypothetical protein